jgi:type I restriction enzyme, S subunit
MDLQLFFDNFDVIAAAPNGVKKLRELILQLAVRGKLVPQDPADEPAGKLLERIRKEKGRLMKMKIAKQDIDNSDITLDDGLFDIPENWQWAKLGEIAIFIDYRGKTPQKTSSGIKLLTAKNVRMGFIKDDPEEFISEATYQEWMTRGFPKYGDLLFTTEAPMGNVAQLLTTEKVALAQRVIDLQVFSDFHSRYLMLAMMSGSIQSLIYDLSSGVTARGIKASRLKIVSIPIPPIEEQKRIVAKVDELMKLCDRLETQQQQNRSHLTQMQKSAIAQLLSAPDADAFGQHWQDIVENFELLFDDVGAIDDLRSAILQLAVQGKLVRQDRSEKSLIEQNLLSIQGFEVPKTWYVSTINDACSHIIDCLHSTPTFVSSGFICVDTNCLSQGAILFEKVRYVPEEIFNERIRRLKPEEGDILFSREGTIGLSAIVPAGVDLCLGQRMMMYRPQKFLDSSYFLYFLASPVFQTQLYSKTTGTAAKHVNIGDIRKMIIPLPPLAEQKRIVAKVNQLMTLCDTLQTHLTQRQQSAIDLAEVAVRQVLDRG